VAVGEAVGWSLAEGGIGQTEPGTRPGTTPSSRRISSMMPGSTAWMTVNGQG
jgi:hypothetical protein